MVTYSSKYSEKLLCPITHLTVSATWSDAITGNILASYRQEKSDFEFGPPDSKHDNFHYAVSSTSFTLEIQPVEAEDEGKYICNTVGANTINVYNVSVEGKILTYSNTSPIISAV